MREQSQVTSSDASQVHFYCCRQDEIDPAIEQYLQENQGFIENFARGTAHMFRLVVCLSGKCPVGCGLHCKCVSVAILLSLQL